MGILFDDFEIDLATREVRKSGAPLGMEPKVYDLLVFLVENADRVVDRDTILEHVWDGRIVSDAAISSCIKAVRMVLGDSGQAQRYIKTVHGRGFRFVGTFAEKSSTGLVNVGTSPSLAILPFDIVDDAKVLVRLADGLADDLLTMLTRIPLLSLASRRSCFALRGTTLSPQEIHRELGVTYILEGSLQQTSQGHRVRLQLVRAESGFHSWAQQFDIDGDDLTGEALLTAVLPRLETALIETMVADLTEAEGARSVNAQLIHAMGLLSLKGWNPASFAEAETVLRDLLQRDPDHPVGRAYLALILGLGSRIGMFEASAEVVAGAIAEAETALVLAGNDSTVLGLAACALADIGQPDRAIPLLRKALDINPNNAQAWVAHGAALLLVEKYQDAVTSLERGIKISAMDAQIAIWWSFLAIATLFVGDAERAADHASTGCRADDRNHIPRVVSAGIDHMRGMQEAKIQSLQDALRINPTLTAREIRRLVGPDLGNALFEDVTALRA